MSAQPGQSLVTPAAVSVTTAGTRVQLSSTQLWSDNVVIQAKPGNSGNIFVGDSNVSSSRGFTLTPGQYMSLEGSRRRDGSDQLDMSAIWLDAATSGDGVQWGYYKRS